MMLLPAEVGIAIRRLAARRIHKASLAESRGRLHPRYSTQKQKKKHYMHLATAPASVASRCSFKISRHKTSQPSAATPPEYSISKKSIRRTVQPPNPGYQPPSQYSRTNANLDVEDIMCPRDCRIHSRRNVTETGERFHNQEEPGGDNQRRYQHGKTAQKCPRPHTIILRWVRNKTNYPCFRQTLGY
jgi:hypothetical protein